MNNRDDNSRFGALEQLCPGKVVSASEAFGSIKRGARIFMGTGCGQPNRLLNELLEYAESNPKNIFDTELYTLLIFGMETYRHERFVHLIRQHCFSMRGDDRTTINRGHGDYNAAFLSSLPKLMDNNLIPIDAALIQTTPPDASGFMSLGISADITRLAVERAGLVIAQVNPIMPRTSGHSAVHIDEVDYFVPFLEPLLEYHVDPPDEAALKIGAYVAQLVEDGSTIQVGFGSTAQAVVPFLKNKRHLGIHTELLSDNLTDLMRSGVVDNSLKTIDRGVSIATFCMGSGRTYDYLHENQEIQIKTLDYTNNPVVIALQNKMVAINGILSVDLTGQATAESIGKTFYSGLGGIADFVRGALLAPEGKSILVLRSTAQNNTVSRIVPFLKEGEGVTVNRGDAHYVITEYGIANLMGKNIRERAMELIRIAHPDFRPWLIEEARKDNLIYGDQCFISGRSGLYPEHMEIQHILSPEYSVLLRPVKISDEPLIKEFMYSLSDRSLYYRYFSLQKEIPHEHLQKIVVIDYMKEMTLLAVTKEGERDIVIGMARYVMEDQNFANFNIVVRDSHQNRGLGSVLLSRLMFLAHERGITGFTLEVLLENMAMRALLNRIRKSGHGINMQIEGDTGLYLIIFNEESLGTKEKMLKN